jgi:micrococcal nuclease
MASKKTRSKLKSKSLAAVLFGIFASVAIAAQSETGITTESILKAVTQQIDIPIPKSTEEIKPTKPPKQIVNTTDTNVDCLGKVTKISDGDTVTFECKNTQVYKVRLKYIDAPETAKGKVSSTCQTQPFALEAKDYLAQLTYGKTIQLVGDKRDKYQRLLGEIFLPDAANTANAKNINALLVEEGLVHVYRYKGTKIPELYIEAESEAQEYRRSIWARNNLELPQDFRKRCRK